MVPDKVAPQGQQDGPEQPSGAADDQEFHRRKMPEPQDVAQVILGEPGDEKQQEDEERALVVEQVIETIHGRLVDESFDKRPPERPRKRKSDIGPYRQPDRGERNSQQRTVQVTAEEPRSLSGNGRQDDLRYLEQNESYEGKGAERIEKVKQLLPVEEEMKEPGLVEYQRQAADDQYEYERFDPDMVPAVIIRPVNDRLPLFLQSISFQTCP